MPRESDPQPLIHAVVSPRFEVFYALQVLESGAGESLHDWRRDMERRLPPRLRTSLASVAPTPLMWPLLADSLRETPPNVSFGDMMKAIRNLNERSFQSFVLGGVFKAPGAVEELVQGTKSLARTVAVETKTQEKLLTLLGLHPFVKHSASAAAFERLVSDASAYRNEVVSVLESFWSLGFGETWARLEPQMKD